MKKFFSMFTAMIITLIMGITTAIPTFAMEEKSNIGLSTNANEQIWYEGVHKAGDFIMTNNNLTPVKIMDISGKLSVIVNYTEADTIGHLGLSVVVYNRTKGTSKSVSTNGENSHLMVAEIEVSKGDRIQIFYDAFTAPGGSNPTGAYRKAHVYQSYSLQR